MANRFWVGGAGTWDATTTHWSATTGGTAGATAPVAADTAVFDANSGTGAVGIAANAICAVCTFGGSGITATLSANNTTKFTTLNISAGTFSTSTFNFGATAILITGGTFTAVSGTIASTSSFGATGVVARTVNLGAATLTVAGAGTIAISGSNLTFNAGTSQINFSNGTPTFAGGGYTFYNVSFTSTAITTCTITGTNTFNNLSFASKSTVTISRVNITGNQTINGAFTVSAPTTLGSSRYFFTSTTYGTPVTITAAATALVDCDLRDIAGAGTAAWTDTRSGDCGGNTGIVFTAKTVYWNLAGSQSYSAIGWATTPTGTPATTNFPLAQDIATFTNTAPIAGQSISVTLPYNIG